MSTPITMPTLSDTMETGRLVKWTKTAGDPVKKGDTVAEVETDKAVMDVEAFHDGFLAGPLAPLNTDLPVGQVIGYITDASGEAAADAPAAGNGAAANAPKSAKPAVAHTPAKSPAHPVAAAAAAPLATKPTPPIFPALGIARTAASAAAKPASPEHINSSPLARRLAEDAGVSLAGVHGSGPHGRIVAADVESAQATSGHSAPSALPDDGVRALYPEGAYDLVPHDAMRRIIAARLVQSNVTIPHFQLTVDCDIGALLTGRHGINKDAPLDAAGAPMWDLSINDFVIKAMAVTLQRIPAANAIWTEAGMLRFHHADIGVAVAIENGLITPVIRNADVKSLSTISAEVKALAARAHARKLKPEEYQGGVSTVSNLGMRGIREFTALINPPQSSILAVGVGEPRPVGRNGQVVLATMMTVTLSCDHRVVDGALGAELIEAFKALIENPVMLAV